MSFIKPLNPGNYTIQSLIDLGIEFNKPNCSLIGYSAGHTFIYGDIIIKRWRPEIQNVTIFGTLTFENAGEIYMNNVWVHPPAGKIGIKVWIRGHEQGNVGWPNRGEEPTGENPRATVMTFTGCHVIGSGNGWYFLDGGGDGGFINHIHMYGGHTAVKGVGMAMVGVNTVDINGHHIDAEPEKGLVIDNNCSNVMYKGAWVEPNSASVRADKQVVIGNIAAFKPIGWSTDALANGLGKQKSLNRSSVERMMNLT